MRFALIWREKTVKKVIFFAVFQILMWRQPFTALAAGG
jgi:hypothetical protein